MKIMTVRLPSDMEKRIKLKAKVEHRSVSEQIKKYLFDGIVCEDNQDLPLSFIRETILAKAEIEAGMGTEYKFGTIK
ncbi:MAG: hypothetical protein ABIJ15_08430 [bacterium]